MRAFSYHFELALMQHSLANSSFRQSRYRQQPMAGQSWAKVGQFGDNIFYAHDLAAIDRACECYH